MNCILQKRAWLAGAPLLAIVLGSGDANAVVFGGLGGDYIIPTTGYYDFRVAGADGGGSETPFGGAGAVVGGELFFDAGDTLDIVVGGVGGNGNTGNIYGGGGGGGSFVFGGGLLFAAGGGAGSNFFGPGVPRESVLGAIRPVRRVTEAQAGSALPREPPVRLSPLSSRHRPDPSSAAAQGHVAISGEAQQEASGVAVAAAMTAVGAGAALPAAEPVSVAIRQEALRHPADDSSRHRPSLPLDREAASRDRLQRTTDRGNRR
jgi:hypothetical protein